MQKGVIAKVIEPKKLVWVAVQFVWMLVAVQSLLSVRKRGFWIFLAMAVTVLTGNIYFLIALKNYALAFYALFVLILASLYAINIYRSLSQVYYHSGQKWFEGYPRFLPRVDAEIRVGQERYQARLSRLGVEGCYAYPAKAVEFKKADSIALKLGDFELDCAIELISRSRDGVGRGFRFIANSADQQKDIKDFIDRVRSSGYVS
jgi:hypothetical protein